MMENRNMTMLCDFYELTMAGGYFKNNMHIFKTFIFLLRT